MEAQMVRKIKAAVKAKLIQMEAYVDDELPDYIMVMVANKKTQPQMTSDLALFLGDDANKFATWLQRILTKIQSITVEKQKKNNNNPESEDDAKKRAKEDNATPDPTKRESSPPPQKKIAMSFKKKIDLKSKISGTTTPLETSPAASPRPHDSLGVDVVSAPSPVSSVSLNNSPTPHRSPPPDNVKDESTSTQAMTKKRKSEEDKKPASKSTSKNAKTKKKKGAEEEEKKRKMNGEEKKRKKVKKEQHRQKDVDKETQIVVIMEQIQRLKQKLLEEQASGSEDEEDEQQQMGDLVRAKIATLRERLESIQEELNGDEEEENDDESSKEGKVEEVKEEEAKEEEVKGDAKKDSGLESCKESDAEVTNDQPMKTEDGVNNHDNSNGDVQPDVDSNDSLGDVAMKEVVVKMPEMTNKSDIDSRCTTPLLDELPSPGGQNSNDTSGDADEEMTMIAKTDEEARLSPTPQSDIQSKTPVAPTPDIYRHLPAFLSNSTDWRRCAQCGSEEKVSVVCLECKAALHCHSSSNCFRAWHLNGKITADVPDREDFKLDTVAMEMK